MYDVLESNKINENNRYINKGYESPYINKNQNLINSPITERESYKNLYIYNLGNNYNSINTEQNKESAYNKRRKETIDSSSSFTKSSIPTNNKYFSKVIVDNMRQTKDLNSILDKFTTENNYSRNYNIKQVNNKKIITFYNEDAAFDFTKKLNDLKQKNPLYKEMNVNLTLTPNENYNKNNFGTIKRRGISTDTIQRLFQGIGGAKREKKTIKKKLNVQINSPFYSPEKNGKKPTNHSYNDKFKDFKDYNKYSDKFPIRVLDSYYNPIKVYNFRSEDKEKWISPSNFVI